jgi:hypothetical protein
LVVRNHRVCVWGCGVGVGGCGPLVFWFFVFHIQIIDGFEIDYCLILGLGLLG